MHKVSKSFIDALQYGFLSGLLSQVVADKDLDLHFRKDYINIYYKGNSLLKLAERGSDYVVEVHENSRTDFLYLAALRQKQLPRFFQFCRISKTILSVRTDIA